MSTDSLDETERYEGSDMSKDTTLVSVDDQVEAAFQRWDTSRKQLSFGMHDDLFRRIALDLINGKFAEEPLPEIVAPPWKHHTLKTSRWGKEGAWNWEVFCMSGPGIWSWPDVHGPACSSEREAILAWNAGMRGEAP